ncbi:MAG: hypothetical protein JNM88_13460 [Chitinophagaceae bacterium]|nr:hypothetical protein [Chitinophagaceae bacterium]
MEAVIKISAKEFDKNLFEKIRSLLQTTHAAELTISIRTGTPQLLEESQAEYWKGVEKAAADINEGKGIVFTMDEFEEYVRRNFPG